MAHILSGQMLINGIDIWDRFGVFLTEEKKGGRENQNAILTASKAKEHVGVDIREVDGKKYSRRLTVAKQERDLTLHFAQLARSRDEWLVRYRGFIDFLRGADGDGWLSLLFPSLGELELRVFYVSVTGFKGLSSLWTDDGEFQACRYKVTFREPVPVI